MRNLEPFQHLLAQTDAARSAESSAKKAHKAASESAALIHETSDDTVFNDLVARNTQVIRDERILDYAEASMRLAGLDKKVAESRTEQISRVILPAEAEKPLIVGISSLTIGESGVIFGAGGKDNPTHSFELSAARRNGPKRELAIRGGTMMCRETLHLGNSSRDELYWHLRPEVNGIDINFADIEIIEDPEEAKYTSNQFGAFYLGEAAVISVIPRLHYHIEPEYTALKAYVASLLGSDISNFNPDNYYSHDEDPKKQLLTNLSIYVTDLMNSRYPNSVPSRVQRGSKTVPLITQEVVFKAYGISQDEVKSAVLKGIIDFGVLDNNAVRYIKEAKGSKQIADKLDEALMRGTGSFLYSLSLTQQESGIEFSADEILDHAIKNPDQYSEIAFSGAIDRWGEDKIQAHFRLARRYKKAGAKK